MSDQTTKAQDSAPDEKFGTQDSFKPGSTPTGKAPAPSAAGPAGAPKVAVNPAVPAAVVNPQPPIPRGRVFTHAELWATISKVQRVAWLKRAGVIGDPQLDKHSNMDWHRLEPKVAVRLLGVK